MKRMKITGVCQHLSVIMITITITPDNYEHRPLMQSRCAVPVEVEQVSHSSYDLVH